MNAALINNVTLCASNIEIKKLTDITTDAFIIFREGKVTGWNTSFWVNTHTEAIVALYLLKVSIFFTPDVWCSFLESKTVRISDGVYE